MTLQSMMKKIVASGMTQEAIATQIRVSQPTVSQIATGKRVDVFYSTGKRLEALYIRCSGKLK